MAVPILHAKAVSSRWSPDLTNAARAEVIVDWLALTPFTSPRRALVAYMAELMQAGDVGTPDALLQAARASLLRKVRVEAELDAAVALSRIQPRHRATIRKLATGGINQNGLAAAFPYEDDFYSMLLSICEPPAQPGGALALLPPYSVLFKAILSESGTLLVKWSAGKWHFDEHLDNRLRFFFERKDDVLKKGGPARRISRAVLKVLVSNGLGVEVSRGNFRAPATLEEVASMACVKALVSLLDEQAIASKRDPDATSPSADTFRENTALLRSNPKNVSARKYFGSIGFHLLLWMRNVDAHSYLPRSSLLDAQLHSGVVEQAAAAAVLAWEQHGEPMKDGEPC